MKKLFAVLMIAGLFGFASCGSNEKKADENTMTDTTAVAPENTMAPADSGMMAPADSSNMAPAMSDTTKK